MTHSAFATEINNDRVLNPVMVSTCPTGLSFHGLMSAVFGLPFPQKFIGTPPNMYGIHHCKDGKFVAVSDLIGYEIRE